MEQNTNTKYTLPQSSFSFKNPFYKKLSNQKKSACRGQALVLLIIFMSIFSLILNSTGKNLLLLWARQKQQQQCRTQALKANSILIKGFYRLLKLNPEATGLRLKRKQAEIKLAVAVTPPAIAAATAHLAAVIKKQELFRSKQLFIIKNSQVKSKLILTQLKGSQFKGLPPFELKATPMGSLSPSYIVPINFRIKQDVSLPWQIKTKTKHFVEGECGSYIENYSYQKFKSKIAFPDII